MSKNILCIFALLLTFHYHCNAQWGVYDGYRSDSAMIRFTSDTIPNYVADTATTPLWHIGPTKKPFYSGDTFARTTIITDTLQAYPINANNWFTIKVRRSFNTIVGFWHKYKTTTGNDGGIVEFSIDSGVTWQNIKGDCNIDSGFMGEHGILTDSFYTFNDTLANGEPAFSGSSGIGSKFSRFQFFIGFPVKGTATTCSWNVDTFYVRFRFISDSVADTLAGWEIDSVKIEYDHYGGNVAMLPNHAALHVYPNPSFDGRFTFPVLKDEELYTTEVYNNMGQRVFQCGYNRSLDLSAYPAGLYFYKVSNGVEYYAGRLLKE